MLNDWVWEKVNKSEYRLKDTSGKTISYLIHNCDNKWFCTFYNYKFNIKYDVILKVKSTEEAILQATTWIYNTCNEIANSYHYIRDHLPDSYELRMAVLKKYEQFDVE